MQLDPGQVMLEPDFSGGKDVFVSLSTGAGKLLSAIVYFTMR